VERRRRGGDVYIAFVRAGASVWSRDHKAYTKSPTVQ